MENTKKQTNTKKIIIGVVIFAIAAVLLAGVYYFFGPKAMKGAKEYTLEVVDDAGKVTKYEARTDAEYLRQALEELEEVKDFSLEGEDGEYGLYIQTVNDLSADFMTDGAYWAVYVNGEYGMYSVDEQPVTDGDAYRLVYESSDAGE